jgi:hypothetical protein
MSLAFVPLTAAQLREWATTGRLAGPVDACAVTPGLQEAFAPADSDEAERTALLVASVLALGRTGRRLVAVAEAAVRARPGGDDDFGEVLVDPPGYAGVTSLFADEPGLDVGAAATASARPLAEAWERPQVQALLADADLLWYGPAEWPRLV